MANDIVEEIYLNGGLDSDSDEKFIRQGDYVDALNIISNEDASGGVITNLQGTKALQAISGQTVVGWCKYDKNNSIILFCSDNGDRIREYNPHLDTLTTIVSSSLLNFQDGVSSGNSKYWVKAAMIDDWLSFSDGYNPNRMVNIADIKADSPTIDLDYLNVSRIPPLYKPALSFERDTAITNNKIVDDAFQFKTQYVYKDYRKSVWGGASDATIDALLVNQYAYFNLDNSNNYIAVSFNSGATEVRFINIAARTSFDSAYKLVIKIDKETSLEAFATPTSATPVATPLSDNTVYYYKFYNSGQYTAVSLEETLQPYDAVPLLSESVSAIGENQFVWGGNTEGKDPIELNVTVTPAYGSRTEYFQPWAFSSTSYSNVTPSVGADYLELTVSLDASDMVNSTYNEGDVVEVSFSYTVAATTEARIIMFGSSTVVFDGTYTGSTAIATYIEANVSNPTGTSYTNNVQPDTVSTSLVGDVVNFIATWETEIGTSELAETNDNLVILADSIQSTYKRGENKKLALIYYDTYGRKWPALTSADCDVYVKNYDEGVDEGRVSLEWVISHDAPLEASYYRWAQEKTDTSFIQIGCTNVKSFKTADLDTPLIALELASLDYLLGKEDTSVFNYTFEEGDIVKVLQYVSFVSPGARIDIDEDRRYTIVGVHNSITNHDDETFTGLWITIKPSDEFGWSNQELTFFSYFASATLEISKKTERANEVYYEVGDYFTCSNGTHSQTTGTVANGYALDQGDVWNRARKLYTYWGVNAMRTGTPTIVSTQYYFLIEDPYPSDFISSKSYSLDSPNVLYPESSEKYDNTIRISNKYFQDTQVNGLSSFDLIDSAISQAKIDISDSHGRIKGLEELGDSLVVICEEKILSSYVGATEYTDTQGNVNVVKSTKSLGFPRPHAENFGTFMKESIINTGKYIYFYDIYNKSVIRKSANGLFPLAGLIQTPQGGYDYRMRTYFKNKSEALLSSLYSSGSVSDYNFSPRVEAYLGYDSEYENIYVTFVDSVDTSNTETIIFNEPSNRWKSKFSLDVANPIDTYLFIDQYFFAVQNGAIYKHNVSSALRNFIYGVQYSSYIQPVSHANPNQIKIYNSLGVHSNTLWTADPIEITANINYPNGFYSKILDTEWEKDEGVFMSDIKRNMKSRSSSATNFDRLNGEALRGNVIKMKLTNSDTTKTELFKIDVGSEISK